MDRKMWEEQFPEMPESFHLAVEQAVEKGKKQPESCSFPQQDGQDADKSTGNVTVRRRKKKWTLLILAAVLCGGLASVIAVSGRKPLTVSSVDFQEKLGLGQRTDLASVWFDDIEAVVAEEPEYVKYTPQGILEKMKPLDTEKPLLSIEKILYDGLQLAVCARPAEEMEGYTIEAWEMTVNGQRILPNEMDDHLGKQDYFIFTAQTCDLELEAPLEIRLPVRVYKGRERYETQELVFGVEDAPAAEEIPDQEFVFEEHTVKLTEMKRSLTAFTGRISIERTEEQEDTYKKQDREIVTIRMEGADGTPWESISMREDRPELSQDEAHKSGYFCYEIPRDGQKQAVLRLMSVEKDSKGEKCDSSDLDHQYGEETRIELDLMQSENMPPPGEKEALS